MSSKKSKVKGNDILYTSGIIECKPEIRYVRTKSPGGYINFSLQQKWVNVETGEIEWIDVPTIEIHD